MKNIYISDLSVDTEVLDFFMVKSFAIKLGANKKQYLDLTLGDKTGEIVGKKWDIADQEITALEGVKDGEVLKVRATVTEWNGLKQLKLTKVRKLNADETFEIMDFVKAAPISPDIMYSYIKGSVVAMKDHDLKALCLRILEDHKVKLMYYPAASKNHHAEMSGLLYHIKRMLEMAERVCDVYDTLNRDLVVTGVIIHDIEKLTEMDSNEFGIVSGYSFEGQMLGHLVQGVKVIDRLAKELNISNEKAIMLEHMMISHHYEAEYGSPKKPLFPEAEILHYLDMMDSKMYDMEEALNNTDPGAFSERVYTMDNRRLYKSKEFIKIPKKK